MSVSHPKAGPELSRRLATAPPDELIHVNIFVEDDPDVGASALPSPPSFQNRVNAVSHIKAKVERSQRAIMHFLLSPPRSGTAVTEEDDTASPDPKSHWINNSISCQLSAQTIGLLLERPDVRYIELPRFALLEDLIDPSAPPEEPAKGTGHENALKRPVFKQSLATVATRFGNVVWNVAKIGAPELWELGLMGEGIIVAIIDTGVNYHHPDLCDHMWVGGAQYPRHGWDFTRDLNDPNDDSSNGHGTGCAGIIAGNGFSGEATGVAPRATLMALKCLVEGRNMIDHISRAFAFAVEHDAHVISMSVTNKLHENPDYDKWRMECVTLYHTGMLHANSIGNEGEITEAFPIPNNIGAPANCPPPWLHRDQTLRGCRSSAVGCGASDPDDFLPEFSGRGPAEWDSREYTDYPHQHGARMGLLKPDVCAPGLATRSCVSTYPLGQRRTAYKPFDRTSAATPHVAGGMALLAQASLHAGQNIVPARIHEALERSAAKMEGQAAKGRKQNDYGSGRIDLLAAYIYGRDQGWWKAPNDRA